MFIILAYSQKSWEKRILDLSCLLSSSVCLSVCSTVGMHGTTGLLLGGFVKDLVKSINMFQVLLNSYKNNK